MASRNFYSVLGVGRSASADDIKKAYRRKARELHPDQNKDNPGAEAEFKQVNEAYDTLKDERKKALYDQLGHETYTSSGVGSRSSTGGFGGDTGGFGSGGFSDLFENMFGDMMGAAAQRDEQSRSQGSDIRHDLTLSLEEAFAGVEKQIIFSSSSACNGCNGTGSEGGVPPSICPTCSGSGRVRAQQAFFVVERPCRACNGQGRIIREPCRKCAGAGRINQDRRLKVNIPQGVETGSRIRLREQGQAGLRGAKSGDLYVFIKVLEHDIYTRDGNNLHCNVPVSIATAALGGELEVPLIDGRDHKLRIPAGSQSGRQFRIGGRGMPSTRRSRGRGDMYVTLFVETPTNLTDEQKSLLRKFDELTDESNSRTHGLSSKFKGFWQDLKS